jgi:hypothetical protein
MQLNLAAQLRLSMGYWADSIHLDNPNALRSDFRSYPHSQKKRSSC